MRPSSPLSLSSNHRASGDISVIVPAADSTKGLPPPRIWRVVAIVIDIAITDAVDDGQQSRPIRCRLCSFILMYLCFILLFFTSSFLVPDGNENKWRRPGVSSPPTLSPTIEPSAKAERNIVHLLPLPPVPVAYVACPASHPLLPHCYIWGGRYFWHSFPTSWYHKDPLLLPRPCLCLFRRAARRHRYWGYSGCPRIIVYVPVEGIVQSFSFSSSYYPRASTADTYSSSSYGRLSLPPLLPLRLPLLLPGPLLTGGTISGRPIEAIVQ